MGLFYRFFCVVLMVGLLVQPGTGNASWYWPFGTEGMEYKVDITGVDDEMRNWLRALGLDKPTEHNPPENLEALGQEANSLAGKIKKALDARGYVESQAEPVVDSSATPPVVRVMVETGVRYPLSEIRVDWKEDVVAAVDTGTLKSKVGEPIDMRFIEEDAVTLMTVIGKDTCLLSLSVSPKLQLHSESRNAVLVFTIDHGPPAKFGPEVITGNEKVKDSVIRRATKWKQGECFESAKIDETRSALIQNQLFSRVEIAHGDTVDEKGEAAVGIAVKERVPRSIGAGVDYSTDIGFGVNGSWQHRNLWGDAEKFDASAVLAQRQQSLSGTLRIPAFHRDDQTLAISTKLKRQDTDAYKAMTLDNSVGVERRLSKRLVVGTGIGYLLADTNDVRYGNESYALVSVPTFAEYDSRNNVLDARKGMFARLSVAPYTETVGTGGQFVKTLGTVQGYLSNDSIKYDPTLALRASLGTIQGGKGANVPADLRFYAGGGGSVRGYSYQALSPQFNDTPIGGASLFEASAEMRLRFTQTLGGVLFLDAGNAYAASTPDLGETLYYGAGTGVRYYSPIGPLRFDVAVPLNGGDIGQTGYQIYVSLGQSF